MRTGSKKVPVEIAATFGDPAGLGPEVGNAAISKFLRLYSDVQIHLFAPRSSVSPSLLKKIRVVDLNASRTFTPGAGTKKSGSRALHDLDAAIDFCLKNPSRILVTGPLDKALCALSRPHFSGHTEYLRKRTKSKGSTMVLAGPNLRVALVTTHIPLKDVARKLNRGAIIQTALQFNQYLRTFIRRPKLAVLGLNPHASDQGLFGTEEREIIDPAVKKLKRMNLLISGPHSPDSFFHRHRDFDGVICMYHDQGLIPLKMIHFYDAVNITLGLPFLRVSVDHGTGFDIVGKGVASSLSYVNALTTAYLFAKKPSSN